jgi:RHS repeat-associated protein
VYTAYGLPVFLNSSFTSGSNTAGWEVLYAGYRFETATSLMHVRHRILNSALGCWVQRDPLEFSWFSSLYEYADSAPLSFTDPSGEFALNPLTAFLSCLAGIGVTLVLGGTGPTTKSNVCRGVGGCLTGLLTALGVLTVPGPFKGCIAGLGFGVAKDFVGPLCDWIVTGTCDATLACQGFKAAFFGVLGCAAAAFIGTPWYHKLLGIIDSALAKYVVGEICDLIATW